MPNVQFFVSGQPKMGHESWPPPKDDKSLSERLYSRRGTEEETRMEVEFEGIGNRFVAYYHFSKLKKNITNCISDEEKKGGHQDHGRPGSFFVISLRFDDVYSADFKDIYYALEDMYEKYVNEQILKRSKEGYLVYQIMKLEESRCVWEHIADELNKMGSETFLNNVKPIPHDTMKRPKKSEYFSLDDNASSIEEVLLNNGRVLLLSSEEMKARKERMKTTNQQLESETTNHKEEVLSKKDEISKKNDKIKGVSYSTDTISKRFDSLASPKKKKYNETDKKMVKNLKWQWIALLILGVGEIVLFILFLSIRVPNLDETVSQPVSTPTIESMDTNTVNQAVEESIIEATETNISEQDTITHLDLRDSELKDAKPPLKRGNSYYVVAQIGEQGAYQDAKGDGKFYCESSSVVIVQEGSKCKTTVFQDAKDRQITICYSYELNDSLYVYRREFSIQ
jgi:hypothetical protein